MEEEKKFLPCNVLKKRRERERESEGEGFIRYYTYWVTLSILLNCIMTILYRHYRFHNQYIKWLSIKHVMQNGRYVCS